MSATKDRDDPMRHLRTWGQIKRMAERAGLCDDDKVFMIDLGPSIERIHVSREDGLAEVADHPSMIGVSP